MRGPKFSTVVNATGCAITIKGQAQALYDVLQCAVQRLRRVSGASFKAAECDVDELQRTGDNIPLRVTWQKNART